MYLWQVFSPINIYLYSNYRNIEYAYSFLRSTCMILILYHPRISAHIRSPDCKYYIFPGQKCFKIHRVFTPILHKIFKTFLKNSALKYNFEGHTGDPQHTCSVASSVATFIPSYMWKVLIKKRWIRREYRFWTSAYASTPLQKGYGRPAGRLQGKLSI